MNRRFLKQLRLIFLIVLSIPQLASATDQRFQDVIRKTFTHKAGIGGGFIILQKKVNHIEICGDLCSYFEWKGDVNDERFWKFIVQYELNDAPGTDVKEYIDNVRSMKGQELLEEKFCTKNGADISTINCDWIPYSKSLGISVGHSRYDEGLRCNADGIAREWDVLSKLKWKCSPMNPKESPFQ